MGGASFSGANDGAMPESPVTDPEQAAIVSKTMYDLYRGAGFTDDQALRLVAYQIAAYAANNAESE